MKKQYRGNDVLPGQVLYYCNPERNIECDKRGCIYNTNSYYPVCKLTSREEFALDEGEEASFKRYPRPKKNEV